MAPEMVKEEGYGRKIDIWALGCTIIEMASGTHPWPDVKNYAQLVY
jgi:mitogen-activated protein kinase kinase kinase 2